MRSIHQIQKALDEGASLEQALQMAGNLGIDAHIENDLLVLDGVIITQADGRDPVVAKEDSIEEALEAAWDDEALCWDKEFMPTVIAVKAFNPAFDEMGVSHEAGTQWKIELLQQPEPPCSRPEHMWLRPIEVVGGSLDNPGVWANSDGGVTITEVCPYCGMTRRTDTLWQDVATGTVWEEVVRYDPEENRTAVLEWTAKQRDGGLA